MSYYRRCSTAGSAARGAAAVRGDRPGRSAGQRHLPAPERRGRAAPRAKRRGGSSSASRTSWLARSTSRSSAGSTCRRLRIWARPAPAGSGARPGNATRRTGRALRRDDEEAWRRAAPQLRDQFVREPDYLNWRYVDSPRDYRCVRSRANGYAVVGRKRVRGSSPRMSPTRRADGSRETFSLLRRCAREIARRPDPRSRCRRCTRGAWLAAGFVPPPTTITLSGRCRGRAAAGRARGFQLGDTTSSSQCARSSSSRSRSTPTTRRSRATVPKIARSRRASTSWSCSPTAPCPGRCPRTAACARLRRGHEARPGRCASSARSLRELRARARRASLAHMCPIYAVLAAPLARPLGVRVLLWYTHWTRAATPRRLAERASNAVLTVDRRSFPLDSRESRRDRARHRPRRFRCAERTPGASGCACSRSGATRPRRVRRRSCARRRAVAPASTRSCSRTARRLTSSSASTAPSSQRLGASCGWATASSRGRVPRAEMPGAARAQGRAREQHARGRARQGRLRGGGDVHAGARVEPRLRRLAPRRAALRPRATRRRSPSELRWFAAPTASGGARARPARARRCASHSVEHWADAGDPRGAESGRRSR